MTKPDMIRYARTQGEQKSLSALSRRGKLIRVIPSVYVDATLSSAEQEELVRRKLLDILDFAYPGSALAYRSAVTLTTDARNSLYLIDQRGARSARKIAIGPFTLHLLPGDTTVGTEPVLPNLKRMTLARVLLESIFAETGAKRGREKFLSREETEAQLLKHLHRYHEAGLNQLRDEARELAPQLNLGTDPMVVLDQRISALLATHTAEGVLITEPALAQAIGDPFDEARLQNFERLAEYLSQLTFPPLPFTFNSTAWRNAAFFESYFSNYIEGTEMTVEEAEQVIFEGKMLHNRQGDSHDVRGCYDICVDAEEMATTPTNADELLGLLQTRHRILMRGRPDMQPGQFKQRNNKAGSTIFVAPDRVIGTLTRGFALYEQIPQGLKRALFIHFLMTEVHPMEDGNGRLGRLMLNAELVAAGEHKILVPTVMRDDYLNGQRHATRDSLFRTISKVLYQLHRYSASLPLTQYDALLQRLEDDGAFLKPDEGIPKFNRARRPYRFEECEQAIS